MEVAGEDRGLAGIWSRRPACWHGIHGSVAGSPDPAVWVGAARRGGTCAASVRERGAGDVAVVAEGGGDAGGGGATRFGDGEKVGGGWRCGGWGWGSARAARAWRLGSIGGSPHPALAALEHGVRKLWAASGARAGIGVSGAEVVVGGTLVGGGRAARWVQDGVGEDAARPV